MIDADLAGMLREFRTLSRPDIEAYIADLEAPLIEEHAALHRNPLPPAEQRARLREIRDERYAISGLMKLWREAHRSPHAGPTQWVGRV